VSWLGDWAWLLPITFAGVAVVFRSRNSCSADVPAWCCRRNRIRPQVQRFHVIWNILLR